MTTTTEPTATPEGKLRADDWISFTRATVAFGEVYSRGASLRLTPDHIRRSVNTKGRSWLDEVDNEGARIQRGQWPAGAATWRYGDPEWEEAREGARRRAWAVLDPAERAAAREAVEHNYGPAAPTSRTLSAPASSPEQRAADEQRRRLDAGGVRAVSNYSPGRRA